MGLDVSVYGKIRISKNNEDCDFTAFVIDDRWNHKIKNLKPGSHYCGDLIFDGVSYAYSSHSRFRELLVKLIEREDLLNSSGEIKWEELQDQHIPFYDFIDFADNEGCLDWEISGKIYSDFEKYNDAAKHSMAENEYYRYEQWRKTFEVAHKNFGVVVFS